jgi:hypothetical protein
MLTCGRDGVCPYADRLIDLAFVATFLMERDAAVALSEQLDG